MLGTTLIALGGMSPSLAAKVLYCDPKAPNGHKIGHRRKVFTGLHVLKVQGRSLSAELSRVERYVSLLYQLSL